MDLERLRKDQQAFTGVNVLNADSFSCVILKIGGKKVHSAKKSHAGMFQKVKYLSSKIIITAIYS